MAADEATLEVAASCARKLLRALRFRQPVTPRRFLFAAARASVLQASAWTDAAGEGSLSRVGCGGGGMLNGLLVLLGCQLAGEAAARGLHLPVPGPVLGMAGLALLLLARPRLHGTVGPVAGALLSNLSLLFVPAAVGVVQVLPLLRSEGVAIGAALVLSTVAALVVTALSFRAVARLMERPPREGRRRG